MFFLTFEIIVSLINIYLKYYKQIIVNNFDGILVLDSSYKKHFNSKLMAVVRHIFMIVFCRI